MKDEEYFGARTRLRHALGRLRALRDDASIPARVKWHLRYAIKDTEDAITALRGEPTRAAG
jgi:hypothetical protein